MLQRSTPWKLRQAVINGLPLIAGDNLFFRAWQFQLPRAILSVPQALVEAMVWSIISYWLIGLAPDAGRWGFWLLISPTGFSIFPAVFSTLWPCICRAGSSSTG